ncbi:MAG: AAA-like domain-containing protein [Cyanobacteria bacterium P01_F01_bin.53]
MSLPEIIQVLERTVLDRCLNSSEQTVLSRSMQGHSYETIAQDSNYVEGYLKVVGSRLWRELSISLGQKITKKNVQSVLTEYVQRQQVSGSPDELLSNTRSTNARSTNTLSSNTLSPNTPLPNKTEALAASRTIKPNNGSARLPGLRRFPRLGGPLPLASAFYIERPPIEQLAYKEINDAGCLLRLKAPCKYGKSSLLLRLANHARALGFRTVWIDFQEAEQETMEHIDSLLRWICANIIQQLNLTVDLREIWSPELGSKINFKAFLQTKVLTRLSVPVVLVFNEVNRVFEYSSIAQDFLPMLRTCYEYAQSSDHWRQLRLVMAYTTDSYVPLNINQSPFNVGFALQLPPFDVTQATALAQRYGLHRLETAQMQQLMTLLGGQPYLLNRAFYVMATQGMPLDRLLASAATPTGLYGAYLHHYLMTLLDRPHLIEALAAVVSSPTPIQIDSVTAYKLSSMGIITLIGHQAVISCELYRSYFEKTLFQIESVSA